MNPKSFFLSPVNIAKKQYEALRSFYTDECSAAEAAKKHCYSVQSFYSLNRDFKKKLKTKGAQVLFLTPNRGRKPLDTTGETKRLIIALRKKYLSVHDIKSVLDVQGYKVSEKNIYNIIKKDGFDRLPRRSLSTREGAIFRVRLKAPKSVMHDYSPETFSVQNGLGLLCLIPYIQQYGIYRLIQKSGYPETETISRHCSILGFTALKLSNVRRYSADDARCMERDQGLSSGLNVIPKTAWYTSYSDNVTREMNRTFLKGLHKIWLSYGLLSDSANLDFTTIPYWGDNSHLENNQSGKRNIVLAGMLSVLAQDPDSVIITYADTTLKHNNKSAVAIEFLDFYKKNNSDDLNYLVFDSKFTTYENLSRLSNDVKFLTIRRRGKNIVDKLNQKPAKAWKKIRIPMNDGKGRTLKFFDLCG
jgi:transposase